MSSMHDTPGAEVVSLGARRGYRADYKGLACAQVRAARERLGLDHDGFAAHLGNLLGRRIPAHLARRWEESNVPPGDVLLASNGQVPLHSILETVPPSLTTETLRGAWVTCYQFGDPPRCHADIAHLEVISDRRVTITNYPPAPRTEGRAAPFRNEIEVLLANRHLVGYWKNVSDARYFGALQLAVLPGETVMQGFFTNFMSDIHVGTGFWKWVRVEPGSLAGADLPAMTLRDPAELYTLLENHSQYDAPLALSTLGEVA